LHRVYKKLAEFIAGQGVCERGNKPEVTDVALPCPRLIDYPKSMTTWVYSDSLAI
jgi:hypothetical protein